MSGWLFKKKATKGIVCGTVRSSPFSAEMWQDVSCSRIHVKFKVAVTVQFGHVLHMSSFRRKSNSQQISFPNPKFFNFSRQIMCSKLNLNENALLFRRKYLRRINVIDITKVKKVKVSSDRPRWP